MKLALNHFSIRTTDMEATRIFYEGALGVTVGPRPDFPFPGLWLYNGSHDDVAKALVHVIGIDLHDSEGLKQYLGDRDVSSLKGSGAVDHIALFDTGLEEKLSQLSKLGIPVRERTVPVIGLHQVFMDDPNGVVIELNYPSQEKTELDAKQKA